MGRSDPYQERARELAVEAGLDPDSRVGEGRGQPVWCTFRDAARQEHVAREQDELAKNIVNMRPQDEKYKDAPLTIFGNHEENTITQMRNCMAFGNTVAGVLCADGHLGYAQPVGGVIAYDNQISVSGVGFDIACGNAAMRLDVKFRDIQDDVPTIAKDIAKNISFGVGRSNNEKAEHELFEYPHWLDSGMEDYKKKAQNQLGTVGSGNHYVDLFVDDMGYVWIGVHFGSRGLGHTTATRMIKKTGGKDGINVAPVLVDVDTDLGREYLIGMTLAGIYAYAGRDWVLDKVRSMIGGKETDYVHNHHNFAWKEVHNGRSLWVVRKGATPANPGERGFVGGSMGDNAVIICGVDGPESKQALYSTIHGAGRIFGRQEAKRRFKQKEMDTWIKEKKVTVIGGGLDESPMAYRRLPDVLASHDHTIHVEHTLRPFIVVMAGEGEIDPWKD